MASAAAAKPTPLDGRFTVRLGQEGQGEEPTAAVLDFSIRGGREHAIPVVVSNVEAGGAAAEAGMEMGCEIIAVDGVSLDNASHAEAVRLLTAPRQSPLELTLRRNHVLKRAFLEQQRAHVATSALSTPTPSTEGVASVNEAESGDDADDNEIDVDDVLHNMERAAKASPPANTTQTRARRTLPARPPPLQAASDNASGVMSVTDTSSSREINSSESSVATSPSDLRNLADRIRRTQIVHEEASVPRSLLAGGAARSNAFYTLPEMGNTPFALAGPNAEHQQLAHAGAPNGHASLGAEPAHALTGPSALASRMAGAIFGRGRPSSATVTPEYRLGVVAPAESDSPLPKNWLSRVDPSSGRVFYVNMLTKATTWLRPRMGNGQPSRSLEAVDWTALPYGWEKSTNATGHTYYINHLDKSNTWDHPRIALQKKQCNLGKELYTQHMLNVRELEGALNAKCNTVAERQTALDRLRQRRVALMATISATASNEARKLVQAKLEVIDDQVEETMQEVFLAVQQAEEHERTVTRQQKLLVAVNRLLSFSAKQVPVLTPAKCLAMARTVETKQRHLYGQLDKAVELLDLLEGFRKQVFIVAGFGQRYQPAMPQQLAQLSEAPLPLPHMDHNGQLKSDFELGIDQLLIGDVLLPALAAITQALRRLWDRLQAHHDTLHGWAATGDSPTVTPSWLERLLDEVSNETMAAHAADLVECQIPTASLERKVHLACSGLDVRALVPTPAPKADTNIFKNREPVES